jgi:zinc transport system substrate-binding protein
MFSGVFLSSENVKATETAPINIYTVNYPLKYFAESIAGQHASVTLPMPADIDPAFWSPEAAVITKLQTADLILLNGANYAKWLPKVSLPLSKLVNTSSEFRDAYIAIESAVKHQHGSGGKHSHTGTAFTTWLDFSQAAQQAKAIFKALSRKRPNLNSAFVKNFIPLQSSLLELDNELTQIGASLEEEAIIGSHPVYQYLKRRYQLNLKSVHWEPEESPSESQWQQLQQLLKTHPAKWMLWEGEPKTETVAKLEELGIKSIVFSPCANTPETGGFLSIMRENIARLKTIIKK